MARTEEVPAFGLLLRQLRAAAGLTQEALAERAGISARGLQKLERGETLPYPDTMGRLTRSLSLTSEQHARLRAAARRPGRGQLAAIAPDVTAAPAQRAAVEDLQPASAAPDQAPERAARPDLLGVDPRMTPVDPRRRHLAPIASQWVAFAPLGRAPQYAHLLTAYEPEAAALGDAGVLGAVYNRLGYCQWAAGALSQARATWTRAAELCQCSGSAAELTIAHVLLQWCRLAQGDFGQVLLCHEHTLGALERAPIPRWHAWALAAVACAYALRGRRDPARAAAREALSLADGSADPDAIACAHGALSFAHTATGDPGGGREHGTLAVEMARAPLERAWAQAALGWAWCRSGGPVSGAAARALDLLAPLLPEVQSMHIVPGEISVMLYLGESYRQAGQLAVAGAMLEAVIARAEPAGMRFHVAVAHRLLAQISLESDPTPGGLASAAAQLEHSIGRLREMQAEAELALALAGYSRLRGATSDAHSPWDDDGVGARADLQ